MSKWYKNWIAEQKRNVHEGSHVLIYIGGKSFQEATVKHVTKSHVWLTWRNDPTVTYLKRGKQTVHRFALDSVLWKLDYSRVNRRRFPAAAASRKPSKATKLAARSHKTKNVPKRKIKALRRKARRLANKTKYRGKFYMREDHGHEFSYSGIGVGGNTSYGGLFDGVNSLRPRRQKYRKDKNFYDTVQDSKGFGDAKLNMQNQKIKRAEESLKIFLGCEVSLQEDTPEVTEAAKPDVEEVQANDIPDVNSLVVLEPTSSTTPIGTDTFPTESRFTVPDEEQESDDESEADILFESGSELGIAGVFEESSDEEYDYVDYGDVHEYPYNVSASMAADNIFFEDGDIIRDSGDESFTQSSLGASCVFYDELDSSQPFNVYFDESDVSSLGSSSHSVNSQATVEEMFLSSSYAPSALSVSSFRAGEDDSQGYYKLPTDGIQQSGYYEDELKTLIDDDEIYAKVQSVRSMFPTLELAIVLLALEHADFDTEKASKNLADVQNLAQYSLEQEEKKATQKKPDNEYTNTTPETESFNPSSTTSHNTKTNSTTTHNTKTSKNSSPWDADAFKEDDGWTLVVYSKQHQQAKKKQK